MILEPLFKIKLNKYHIFKTSSYRQINITNQEEVEKFSKWSEIWWNLNGPLKGLHSINKIRVPFIREGLITSLYPKKPDSGPLPLKNFNILDIGCGGGILSEPLARLGARVTGLDANHNLIQIAKEHASFDKSITERINYINDLSENFISNKSENFDAVIISEIIEHIDNKEAFLSNCTLALKPGGSLFVTTINKTFLSWLCVIILTEHLFGNVPVGTHDWEKFISPDRIRLLLEKNGCRTLIINGTFYNVLTNEWTWVSNSQFCYALHAIKNK